MVSKKSKRIYYLIGIAVVLILLGVIGFYLFRSPFLDREIKGQVTISSYWLEITPDKPLKPERDVEEVELSLEPPFIGDFESHKVRLPDGSLVLPEVQLIDQNGNTFNMKYRGFNGRMNIYFSNFDELPKDREYRTVRIRSEKPINCKKIYWSCYYTGDIGNLP